MSADLDKIKKIAVVLFNLGGPKNPEDVRPFLFNLFNDKAIITAPFFIRYFLANLISFTRKNTAIEIYKNIGGGSPILKLTNDQADALEKMLNENNINAKVFVSMRYWHPMANEIMDEVIKYTPDEVVLLPLYPQFSTTTTESSFNQWDKLANKKNFNAKTHRIISYQSEKNFIAAHIDLLNQYKDKFSNSRILFSAHGLPQKIADLEREIYQDHVEETVASIVSHIDDDIDYVLCYQSRVGPLKWIGPSTDDEIKRAAEDKKDVIIVPVAFVSEHSETLVELDIEYREEANKLGIKNYYRVPALGCHTLYIKSLYSLVNNTLY